MINIKERRKSKGIKCSELAEAMGISVKEYKRREENNSLDILRFMHPTDEELDKLDIRILWFLLKNRRFKIDKLDVSKREKVPFTGGQ